MISLRHLLFISIKNIFGVGTSFGCHPPRAQESNKKVELGKVEKLAK
jgi:hypothetical protein